MQCGQATGECPAPITLPTVPGLLRLWDSHVFWSSINDQQGGPYNWKALDAYLDAIAADPSHPQVLYTFGWVPCWNVPDPQTECIGPWQGSSPYPPKDLGQGSNGSATFNAFVQALVTHCTTEQNPVCVKDKIKYFELWNEANTDGPNGTWHSTEDALWSMVRPAAGIIKANVPGAQILTPSVCDNRDPNSCKANVDFEIWLRDWLALEGPYGSTTNISNIYNFHVYLNNETPEARWADTVQNMLAPRTTQAGWSTAPWWDTETNYNGSFTCDSPQTFTTEDCIGQIARWQLLHNSNSASGNSANLSWYKWNTTIGFTTDPDYFTAYKSIKLYLTGGSFSSPCSESTTAWTCPFTEAGSRPALFVWTTNPNGANYTVPPGFADYRDLKGETTAVTSGEPIIITVEPIMLEGPPTP
jgi:hypothetical protein